MTEKIDKIFNEIKQLKLNINSLKHSKNLNSKFPLTYHSSPEMQVLKAEIDKLKNSSHEINLERYLDEIKKLRETIAHTDQYTNNMEQEMKESDKCCEDVKLILEKLVKEKEEEKKEQEKKETADTINDLQTKVDLLLKDKQDEEKKKELEGKDKCCEEIKKLFENFIKEKVELDKENNKKEEEQAKQACMDELKKLKGEIERVSKAKLEDKESSCQEEVN